VISFVVSSVRWTGFVRKKNRRIDLFVYVPTPILILTRHADSRDRTWLAAIHRHLPDQPGEAPTARANNVVSIHSLGLFYPDRRPDFCIPSPIRPDLPTTTLEQHVPARVPAGRPRRGGDGSGRLGVKNGLRRNGACRMAMVAGLELGGRELLPDRHGRGA
jgi:hypothetical protein